MNQAQPLINVSNSTPLLLRRVTLVPEATTVCGHMTVVTTRGFTPENSDQKEDKTRYDKD